MTSPYLTGVREEGRGFEIMHQEPLFNETYRREFGKSYDGMMPPTFMNSKKVSSMYEQTSVEDLENAQHSTFMEGEMPMRVGEPPQRSSKVNVRPLEPKFYYLPTDEEEEEEMSSVSQATPYNESAYVSAPISSVDEVPKSSRFEV